MKILIREQLVISWWAMIVLSHSLTFLIVWTLLHLVFTRKSDILKQISSWKLQACLSICELLLNTWCLGLKKVFPPRSDYFSNVALKSNNILSIRFLYFKHFQHRWFVETFVLPLKTRYWGACPKCWGVLMAYVKHWNYWCFWKLRNIGN